MARSKMSLRMQIGLGVIFLVAALIFPFYMCKQMSVSCNSSDSEHGRCIITSKGLIGQTSEEVETNQIENISYQEIKKSKKRGYYYEYRIIINLRVGKEVVLPVDLPVNERDQLMQQFTPILNGYNQTKVSFNYDNRQNTLIVAGILILIALIMIVTGFFKEEKP